MIILLESESIVDCDGCEYGDWIGTSMFSISQSTPPFIDEGIEIEASTDIYQDDLIKDGYIAIGQVIQDLVR